MPELQLRKEIDRWVERAKHLHKRLADADTQKQAIEDAPEFFDDFQLSRTKLHEDWDYDIRCHFSEISDPADGLRSCNTAKTIPDSSKLYLWKPRDYSK